MVVDLPGTVSAHKLEITRGANFAFLDALEGAELGADLYAHVAVVARPLNDEFHERGWLAAIDLLGTSAVFLLHDVLEVNLVRSIAEVHNGIDPLGHGQGELPGGDGFGELPGILPELNEPAVAQAQMVDPRVGCIEEAQPILPALDFEERLHRAVDGEDVAQAPVVVQKIVGKGCARRIEDLVHEGERDVRDDIVIEARHQGGAVEGGQHAALDQIEFDVVLNQVEAGEALADEVARHVHSMLVVPHGRREIRDGVGAGISRARNLFGGSTSWSRAGRGSGPNIGVVIISAPSGQDVEVGVAVRVGRCVITVQVD